jgi:hypothetical protein
MTFIVSALLESQGKGSWRARFPKGRNIELEKAAESG